MLDTPEIRNTPLPIETIETWIGSQYDCRAGTTGAAFAYRTVPATNMRTRIGIRAKTHSVRRSGRRNSSSPASTAAAHVKVTNSYMLPQGTRCVATPRRTSAPRWNTNATTIRDNPMLPSRSDIDRGEDSTIRPGALASGAVGTGPALTPTLAVGVSDCVRTEASCAQKRIRASRYTRNAVP